MRDILQYIHLSVGEIKQYRQFVGGIFTNSTIVAQQQNSTYPQQEQTAKNRKIKENPAAKLAD